MIIKELIEKLRKYPLDMLVVVDGYEEGFNDIQEPIEISLALNVNYGSSVYGTHDYSENYSKETPVIALLLPR